MPSRRQFLRQSAIVGALALSGPVLYQFRPTNTPDFPMQQDTPGARILVTYASMMGSTGEQAEGLARTLGAAGHKTHLVPVKENPDPSCYDAVIMGSAIRAASWLEEMIGWASAHRDTLANIPAALFQCSMTCAGYLMNGQGLSADETATLARDLDSLFDAAPALRGKPRGFFPGRIDYDDLTPMIRLSYPIVSGSLMLGDYRDPAAVAQWGRTILARDEMQKALAPVAKAG